MIKLLLNRILFRLVAVTLILLVTIAATVPSKEKPVAKNPSARSLPTSCPPFLLPEKLYNDPIRFNLRSNRNKVALGQPIELN